MDTFITTKSFHEVTKNGKVIDKKMLNAKYDGNIAVIDTLHHDKAYRFELTKQDIQNMLKKLVSNKGSKPTINTDFLGDNSSIKEYLISKQENPHHFSRDKTEKKGKKVKKGKKDKKDKTGKIPNAQSTRSKHKKKK